MPPAFQTPAFQTIPTNDVHLRALVLGSGPLVVFVHGFPESWYSWRHQLGPVAAAGFKVVAPDVRGYGGSDKPDPIAAYDMENMTADVAGIIDTMGATQATLVGHDWGAPIAWNTAALYPDRVRAVVALSVPHARRGPMSSLQLWKKIYRGRFFYQIYFQTPGVAEAELEADVRASLKKLFFAASGDAPPDTWLMHKPADARMLDGLPDPDPFPAWMSAEDLDYYVSQFERSGFTGALNRYRNLERDWARLPQLGDLKVEQPALFIAGTKEIVFSFVPGADLIENMRASVPNLEKVHLIEGAGHWIQQERPGEVTEFLLAFLAQHAMDPL
ncbi:MAG: alpha/beta fold hydrolase [Gammaproteobacteria bacterium]